MLNNKHVGFSQIQEPIYSIKKVRYQFFSRRGDLLSFDS